MRGVTAPADLAVTVTASSVSSPAANGSATLTVAAISIGVAPLSALVPLNATLSFTGNASYDPSAVEAKWQRIWEERGTNRFTLS